MVCDSEAVESDRFVVFLHVDLRSDGLITAASVLLGTGRWFGMQDGVVVVIQGLGIPRLQRLVRFLF